MMTDLERVEQILLHPEGEERIRIFLHDMTLREILPELYRLEGVPQPPEYHPEGDALAHTLLAVRLLPPHSDRRLAWAVLLHDVGKAQTTRDVDGRIRAYGHDGAGAELSTGILARLGMDRALADDVVWLVRHHMFALSWHLTRKAQLTRRHRRFIADHRFPLLLDLMEIDTLAAAARPEKLEQVAFYRSEAAAVHGTGSPTSAGGPCEK
jgi:hypothetical protein